MSKFKVIMNGEEMDQLFDSKEEAEMAIAFLAGLSQLGKKKAKNKQEVESEIKTEIIEVET